MTPHYAAGTRPNSLQSESWLFMDDSFDVNPTREYMDVIGVAAGGDVPQYLYSEGWAERVEINFSGMPVPTAAGAYQGLCAAEDAATLASLNNLIDNEVFGIVLSQGTIQSRNPTFKKARTGKGRVFDFKLLHCPFM